jgi:pilus assembly protein FimV
MGSNDPADREDIALSTSELDDVLGSAEIRSESGNDEEAGLEKYGIWIKIEPETLAGEVAAEEGLAGARLTAEEEQLLGELESDSQAPTLAEQTAGETPDFEGLEKDLQELDSSGGEELDEEVPDLDLEMEPEQARESEIEVPLSESVPELDSLEEAPEAQVRGAGPISSDAILKKIEQDLKQIRLEIQNLKRELAGRGGEAGTPHAEAAAGFFSEEEDDSIALTGDELDNILNTAEITEEQARSSGPEEDLQAAGLPEALEELEEPSLAGAAEAVEELEEPSLAGPAEALEELEEPSLAGPAEALEELEEPSLPGVEEDLELLEPGSLSAEPEPVQIELEQKPAPVDLDLGGLTEELPATGDLELEELEEEGTPELVLEEAAEAPLPQPAQLGLEEAPPEEALSLDELSEAPAAEPAELEPAAAAEAPAAEPLELVEELPDLSLADEQAPAGEEAEPMELELAEEAGEAQPLAELPAELPAEPGIAPPAGQPEEHLPEDLREDVKSVLSYLDQLLEALPEDKIRQFAQSEYLGVYKRLFEELGLGA